MTDAIRLLHVDDDPQFTELTAEVLDREFDSFDIVQAADATEGLEYVTEMEIDCVVSDYKLPGMDGVEFLTAVRRIHPELPFILFTGKGSETVASDAITAGATDYFQKDTLKEQYDLLANRILNAVSATRAKERVKKRTREYRTLVEEAPIPMLVISDEYEIRYVNGDAVDVFEGDGMDELVGTSAKERLPEENNAESLDRLDYVLTEREPVEAIEYEFVGLDGTKRYGRGTIVPVTFDDEPAAQIVVSDLTKEKQQESQVRHRQTQITQLHDIGVELAGCESHSEVYELMVDAAVRILDLDLCVVDSVEDDRLIVEATSSELTEYEEAPLEEGGLAAKAYLDGDSYLIGDIENSPDADPVGPYKSSITVPLDDFGVFQAAAREANTFDNSDLELVEILKAHVCEALTRIEQEEQLREQHDKLERENERLDEFASIVSHDIRNPLNVAQLRLDLAMEECESDHLDTVARSVERMETLTDELLALARMGSETLELESVSLSTVARGCWHNVETGETGLTIATDGKIEADTARLQQLLENLFRNAVEHGGPDVTVTIGLLDDEGGFFVEDDGPGLTEEAKEQAFDSGYSTRDNGTGFGLAIVSRASEAHGWDVSVSDSETGGARFTITGVSVID